MLSFYILISQQLNRLAAACGGTVTASGDSFDTCLPKVTADSSALKTILQLVFGVIGSIAIIYIMYGAFRFVRSQGEPNEIAQARQTIIFAALGLAIAISAETIVAFALGKF